MISSNKFQFFIKKTALLGCLSFSLTVSCLSPLTTLAGPADDSTISTQGAGPGGGASGGQAQTPIPPSTGSYLNPQYYDLPLANPVVNPVDKYSYDQMEQDINMLSAFYNNNMKINIMGQSWDGRNLYEIIVGNPNASKHVLFQGAIHAREYITVPLMMQQMEYLLAHYNTGFYNDQPISALLNNVAIHFVPMANPDGVSLSQFGEGAIRSDVLRQMIQACYAVDVAEGRTSYSYDQYLARWKSNGRGVDLNHNFDAGWASLNPNLNHFSSTDFKGEAPLSEPESQALADLTNKYSFSAVINYHAMGNVLYWNTANNQKTEGSLAMAQMISGETGYQILGSLGVGGLKDWLQQRVNPVAGVTIEIGRSACPVSFSEYPVIWIQNKGIPAMILNYAYYR